MRWDGDARQKKCSYRINKAFHGLAAGVRFSPTEGYAWDFSSDDKKAPVIPSERASLLRALLRSSMPPTDLIVAVDACLTCAELQLKLKQKLEKMEKQRENSARVDSILIQLMKKHAPEIVEKLEAKDKEAAGAAAGLVAAAPGSSGAPTPAGTPGPANASDAEAAKRQKVA
jgi:hypothetical protein